jgi:hypothetical protein
MVEGKPIFWPYVWQVFRLAFARCRCACKGRVLWTVALVIAGALIGLVLRPETWSVVVSSALFSLAAPLLGIVVVYVIQLVMAPAHIHRQDQQKIMSLDSKIALLEECSRTAQRKRELCDTLAAFIHEGVDLRRRCANERGSDEVSRAAHDWAGRAAEFIRDNLSLPYLVRFKDCPSYLDVLVNYPSDKMGLYNSIRGRVDRLHEFLKEVQPPLN